MSVRARQAVADAAVVVGYHVYLDLIGDLLAGKEVIGTGMRQEIARCRAAVAQAVAGRRVAVVCSGDPGVYGMAGLVLELLQECPPPQQPAVEIIPGISAVNAAAALLGAPLMHDFAVISLSDLLTPWEVIRRRLAAAAMADFVIALYNPRSATRVRQIVAARDIIRHYRPDATPVGVVRNAGRPGQDVCLARLDDFTALPLDMFSLVIVGNSRTYVSQGRMITPRGYQL